MSNPNFNPTLSTDEVWVGENASRCLTDELNVMGFESTTYPGCYYRTVNGATEWINPPMVVGNEYRTTERWNGKVLYTKLVDLGLSTEGAMTCYHSMGASNLIRCSTVIINTYGCGELLPIFNSNSFTGQYSAFVTSADVDKICLYINSGMVGLRIYATYWYTKD